MPKVMWQVTSHVVFQKWWSPHGCGPAMLRLFGAQVGQAVHIRQGVRIHWPWRLRVDGPAWIGHGTGILNLDQVVIGRTCA